MSKDQKPCAAPGPALTASAEAFLQHEYDALREELMECVKESRQLERNALLSSAALWAWAIANKDHAVYQSVLYAPPLLTLLSALRAWALWKHLGQLCAYISRVETRFKLPTDLGWERHFADSKDHSKSRSAAVFWLVLFASTLFGAIRY